MIENVISLDDIKQIFPLLEGLQILYNILSNKKRQELADLDYSINNLRLTYNCLKSNHDKKLKETEDKLKSKYECSICMENTREYACIPCGHTYCEECCKK